MKKVIHNVLGTPYAVLFGNREQLALDECNAGECRIYSKVIKVCTEKEDCTETELEAKILEIIAHEIFHAYLNEAGIDLDSSVEEQMASFFMKNWKKMSVSISDLFEFDRQKKMC